MGITPTKNQRTCCKYNPVCNDKYALKNPCLCKAIPEKCKVSPCSSVRDPEKCQTEVLKELSEKAISLCEKSCNTCQVEEVPIQTEKVKKKKGKKSVDSAKAKSQAARPISNPFVLKKNAIKPQPLGRTRTSSTQPIKGRLPSPTKRRKISTQSVKSVDDTKTAQPVQAPIPSPFVENQLPLAPVAPAQLPVVPVPASLPVVPVPAQLPLLLVPGQTPLVPVPGTTPVASIPAQTPLVPVPEQPPSVPVPLAIPAQFPTGPIPTQFPSVPATVPMSIIETKDTATSTPSANVTKYTTQAFDEKTEVPTKATTEPVTDMGDKNLAGGSEMVKSFDARDADAKDLEKEASKIMDNLTAALIAAEESLNTENAGSKNEVETTKVPIKSETETIKAPTSTSGARSANEVESLKVPLRASNQNVEDELQSIKTPLLNPDTENSPALVASPINNIEKENIISEEIAEQNLESAGLVESSKSSESAATVEGAKLVENPLEEQKVLRKQSLLAPVVVSSKPIVWVLGGPGSGKGTQCEKIIAKYGFTHLSTGDLLRAEVKSGSDRAKTLTAIMERGELVPNEVVLDLLKEAMQAKMDSSNGFLIDGYPREESQGIAFEKAIAPVSVILYFEASAETLTKRLLGRAASSGRADDNEATIKLRLKTFMDNNEKVLAQYPSKLVRINAERSVDEIFADVQKSLDSVVAIKT